MSTELATVEYSGEQIDLLKRTICNGASNDEFGLFLQQCKRTGLDPFSKQIHAVFRNAKDGDRWIKKMAIQIGIDGFRLIADRTGRYEGQMPPQWCGTDGVWKDVWLEEKPPAAARIGIYRKGFREPLIRVATYLSYFQTNKDGAPNSMWAKMPDVMISKCAESIALRAAFPQELSGLYTDEEMPQGDVIDHNGNHPQQVPAPAVQQQAKPAATASAPSQVFTMLSDSLGHVGSRDDLTSWQAIAKLNWSKLDKKTEGVALTAKYDAVLAQLNANDALAEDAASSDVPE